MADINWIDGEPFAEGIGWSDAAWIDGLPLAEVTLAGSTYVSGVGDASGSATAQAAGEILNTAGSGAATGLAIAAGVALFLATGAGFAGGVAAAAGVAGGYFGITGLAASDSIAEAVGVAIRAAAGQAHGESIVEGVGQSGLWPESVMLRPTVTDDGWCGALSYAWAQVSGPDTATILSPAAQWTMVMLPETTGVYVFSLAVSRADDALIGIGLWRVTVYTDAPNPSDANIGPVTVTANTAPIRVIVKSVRINETHGRANTCGFAMPGASAAVGNDIVLERGARRLFGGVCLSITRSVDDNHNILYDHALVGYAWHLGRRRVTKAYVNTSITDIVLDLLSLAPGGIGSDYVAAGLETVDVTFDDVALDEALTQVARPIGAHWQVDYFNQLHFAVTEAGSDPLALSPRHPTMQHLSITDDLSQVVNRVTVHYDRVTVKAALVDAEIAVDSLDGYSPSGGLASIGGNTVTYAGTRSALIDPVYGHVPVDIRQTAVEIAGEGFAEWTSCGYSLSLSTSLGETPLVAGRSGYALISPDTAFDLTLTELYGSPAAVARVTRVNIYRNSNEGAGVTFLVGSVLPTVGSRFTDRTPLADIPTPLIQAPSVNSADARGYWLTGCSGSQDVHTPASVMVEDPDAQDALAALLGGADDGIIEASLQGGTITTAEAITLATTYLNTQSGIRTSVSCDVRDDKAHPGQVLSVNFPAPIDCVADLKIQSTSISDLEPGVPHKYSVVAANDLVTMEDILKHSSVGSP